MEGGQGRSVADTPSTAPALPPPSLPQLLALIGEQFDVGGEVCGVIVSSKFHDDTIAIWNRSADNDAAIARIR